MPDRYKETSTIIKDFIRSPNFNDFMEIYQPPKKTQTETKTEANEQLVSPEKRQKPENSMISIKEPEIEDRLAIEMATNNPLDGIDFASSQNSDTSESDLELVMNDIPDYLLIKLKELYDFLSKIENLENRKSFINFMVKTVAAASLTDVD